MATLQNSLMRTLRGWALALGSVLAAPLLQAASYPQLDVDSIVAPAPAPIDQERLALAVGLLAQYANTYPLRFDSQDDLIVALRDATELSQRLRTHLEVANPEPQILLLSAQLNTQAWRMGMKQGAELAFEQFSRLLRQSPDDMRANYLLGSFLSEFDEAGGLARRYLIRADQGGIPEAAYTLGMLSIGDRDIPAAKVYLERYAIQAGIGDEDFKRLLRAVSSGRVRVNFSRLPALPAGVVERLP
ncbi:hypothetical protein [Uliginosibacterium sediminicola]|uniref:Tetratricopeptide repeat protein n=1 Tax=Uliginosibacterium sediminicola TaxID=2024550 RepID=A0ABU9YTS7_9RHOO